MANFLKNTSKQSKVFAGCFVGWAISRCLSTTPHPMRGCSWEYTSILLCSCYYLRHFIQT